MGSRLSTETVDFHLASHVCVTRFSIHRYVSAWSRSLKQWQKGYRDLKMKGIVLDRV